MNVVAKNWDKEHLLEQLMKGNQQAFAFVVQEYSGFLLQRAFRLAKDQHLAEDLVQDVLVDLWEHRSKHQIVTSLEGYLYSMLKHRFLRLVSRSNLHDQAVTHLVQRMDQLQTSILDVMAATDLQQTLTEAVSCLPENMRKIFVLRDADYTLREIAEALGLAEQTVKSYHAELNRRIKETILAKHPDISHSLFAVIVAGLMKS